MHIKQLAGYSKMYTFAFLCYSVKDGGFMNLLPLRPHCCLLSTVTSLAQCGYSSLQLF